MDIMGNDSDASHTEESPAIGGGKSEPDSIESAKATRGSTASKLEGTEFDTLLENHGFEDGVGYNEKAKPLNPTYREEESRKKSGWLLAAFLAGLGTLFAIAASTRYRHMFSVHPKGLDGLRSSVDVPVDPESLGKYERELDAAIEDFSQRWKHASRNTKRSFQREYFPAPLHTEAFVSDAATVLKSQVSDFRLIRRPVEADTDDVKRQYALQTLLYAAVCRAATSRLMSCDENNGLIMKYPMHEMAVDTLHRYWSDKGKHSQVLSEQATFQDFDEMLGTGRLDLRQVQRETGEQQQKTAPKIFALKLASMMVLVEAECRADRRVHAAFSSFVHALGGGDQATKSSADGFRLLPSETRFDAAFFRDAFDRFEDVMNVRKRGEVPVEAWAEAWGGALLLQRIDTLEQERKEWIENRRRLRRTVLDAWKNLRPEDSDPVDMVAIALHLL